MKRLTQKDDNGYYLTGDGVYSDWGVPEKFRGEDIDRIAAIEDILGDEYELDDLRKAMWSMQTLQMTFAENTSAIERLRELWFADREGRCVVLPVGEHTDKDGENALKSAMNTCYYHNNPVTRFIADAVAEKLVRAEVAQKAREQE